MQGLRSGVGTIRQRNLNTQNTPLMNKIGQGHFPEFQGQIGVRFKVKLLCFRWWLFIGQDETFTVISWFLL